jgi:hypothetical protein
MFRYGICVNPWQRIMLGDDDGISQDGRHFHVSAKTLPPAFAKATARQAAM